MCWAGFGAQSCSLLAGVELCSVRVELGLFRFDAWTEVCEWCGLCGQAHITQRIITAPQVAGGVADVCCRLCVNLTHALKVHV